MRRIKNDTVEVVTSYSSETEDTTIIDDNDGEGLRLETEYNYEAVAKEGKGNVFVKSKRETVTTLGTTSHAYTWTETVIGEFQSSLWDVWGTDENNVYAVGALRINEKFYGILHWNGSEWTPIAEAGGYSIHGFAPDDIWVVGGGVWYYNGISWISIDEKDTILAQNGQYTSIWGTSSNNLYMGNIRGKIIHWDGEKAKVMDLPVSAVVFDIYGINNNFIFAAGVKQNKADGYDFGSACN